jgi:hypothetical protein
MTFATSCMLLEKAKRMLTIIVQNRKDLKANRAFQRERRKTGVIQTSCSVYNVHASKKCGQEAMKVGIEFGTF